MGIRIGVDASTDASPDSPVEPPRPAGGTGSSRARRRIPHLSVIVVLAIGVIITAGLSAGAAGVHNSNENRLLRQRAREVAAVAGAAIPTTQTPLASAAVLAEATSGNASDFRGLMGPIVAVGRPFASVSLWPVGGVAPLVVVGVKPALASESPSNIRAYLQRATGTGTLALNNLLASGDRRLGYGLSVPSPDARYVIYGEAVLPKSRRATIAKDSAFSDLGYALYLGKTPDSRFLLASSTGGALLHGRKTSVAVPFGDSQLLVVLTPHTELGGTLLAQLWWMLGALGLVLTVGAASLVGGLTRRRERAEMLAIENERLYAEQRTVAQTLQHSLLAEAFPDFEALEFSARYVAGVEGIDVGGDWYDVVRLENGNALLIVGDVSGRGLEAATMMASLRYAARAFASENYPPAVILSKLRALFSIGRDGHFATVLCALLDVPGGRMTVANAGHPQPLLVSATGAEFIATAIGPPVGAGASASYSEVECSFPRGSTLLLYTDGAIERRGERLDAGWERLKTVSAEADGSLDEFITKVASGVIDDGSEDDTALLGVRWRI